MMERRWHLAGMIPRLQAVYLLYRHKLMRKLRPSQVHFYLTHQRTVSVFAV